MVHLSKEDMAKLIQYYFPCLNETSEGQALLFEIKNITKDTHSSKDVLNQRKVSDGARSLLSFLPNNSREERPSSGQGVAQKANLSNSSLRSHPEFSAAEISVEHPLIAKRALEALGGEQRKATLNSLPGKMSRQLSFLFASDN